jgi:hypothetical protein
LLNSDLNRFKIANVAYRVIDTTCGLGGVEVRKKLIATAAAAVAIVGGVALGPVAANAAETVDDPCAGQGDCKVVGFFFTSGECLSAIRNAREEDPFWNQGACDVMRDPNDFEIWVGRVFHR